jgi:hypothetical protein
MDIQVGGIVYVVQRRLWTNKCPPTLEDQLQGFF